LNTEDFVEKARLIHADKYQYPTTKYIRYAGKVEILCPSHGIFLQRPADHLYGKGCKKCASPLHDSTEGFISKAIAVHGDKYDYSGAVYTGSSNKVKIICGEHGSFEQSARAHLKGKGCRACSIRAAEGRLDSKEDFIRKAIETHGDLYSYNTVVYATSKKEVTIVCRKHGAFSQKPNAHIQGHGCPKCSIIKVADGRRTEVSSYLAKAREFHNDKYDYSKVNYVNSGSKIEIGCPEHGYFLQSASHHLSHGCRKCSSDKIGKALLDTKEDFVKKAKEVHGDLYSYEYVRYSKSNVKVSIECKKHGVFEQAPYSHLNGQGCKHCANVGPSKNEIEMSDFLSSLTAVVRSDRIAIAPLEIDCLLPDRKTGVEFCGLYFHSAKFRERDYHIKKLTAANAKGLRLVQVFEDEWLAKKDIVKSVLKNIVSAPSTVLYARKMELREVSKEEAKNFLDLYHLQGHTKAEIRLGLYSGEELAMLATFSVNRQILGDLKPGWAELVRLCSVPGTRVVGGFAKLLKRFVSCYSPSGIKTYCDLRYFTGKGYEAVGFSKSHVSAPGYSYVKNQRRYSRYAYQKHLLKKKLEVFDPSLSEEENMTANNFHRIYDCGNIVYVMDLSRRSQ